MDVVIQAALVGLLQGLTEFIPISSSAHLELAPWIAGWQTDGLIGSLAFDVFLHLGTLVALLIYFARDWIRYI
nr:UDP-diphosphatase [Chloroflexota bacterium]